MIRYKCAKCHSILETNDSLGGRTEPCPLCQHVNKVPKTKKQIKVEQKQRQEAEQSRNKSSPDANQQVQGAVHNASPASSAKTPKRSKRKLLILGISIGVAVVTTAIILILTTSSPTDITGDDSNKPRPSQPPAENTAAWSAFFKDHGWTLEKDDTVGDASWGYIRFISFKRDMGDLKLNATIMSSRDGLRITGLSLGVRGSLNPQTPPVNGFRICRETACGLLLSVDEAVSDAIRDSREQRTPSWGLRRKEGTSITHDGWEVAVVEYLVGRSDSDDNALMLINLLRKTQAATGTKSSKIGISDIGFRKVDSGYGIVTVAWKACIENHLSEAGRFTVEAVFIDKDEFELTKDCKYNVFLQPGESRTVTGSVMIKAQVFQQIANLIIKVRS